MSKNQVNLQTAGEDQEPTLYDVLGAISQLSTHIDGEIGSLKSDVSDLKSDVSSLKSDVSDLKSDVFILKSDVSSLKSDMTTVKSDINHIKSVMVTKDYLDDKLFDLKGDLITLTRKEDQKVVALTQELLQNKVISQVAAKRILALEPFPQ